MDGRWWGLTGRMTMIERGDGYRWEPQLGDDSPANAAMLLLKQC